MKAGRELDAEVARLMGVQQIQFLSGDWQGIYPPTRGWVPVGHYSSNISAAWEVVEFLRSKDLSVDVHAYPDTRKWLKPPYEGAPSREWELTPGTAFYKCTVCHQIIAQECWTVLCDPSGETPAEAICLAALKAEGAW